MATLFHISGWGNLATKNIGDTFALCPGPQGAEGVGVYFSEAEPRLTAAEGCRMCPSAIVEITTIDNLGWWQSKAARAKKFGKPRTWHSDTKDVQCVVTHISEMIIEGRSIRVLHCTWKWA